MKSYFSTYKLYDVKVKDGDGHDDSFYAVDDSLIGASCVAHEAMQTGELLSVEKIDKGFVLVPVMRVSKSKYKLFHADLHGEYNGAEVWIVAHSLTVAAAILEEYCHGYYTVSNFYECTSKDVFVNPNNPETLEED